jgi:hypothetical protein
VQTAARLNISDKLKSRRPRTDREWFYFAAFWIGVVLVLVSGGLIR